MRCVHTVPKISAKIAVLRPYMKRVSADTFKLS